MCQPDFSIVFRSAIFIEIALSIFAVRRCPTFSLQIRAKEFGERRRSSTLRSRNRPLVKTCPIAEGPPTGSNLNKDKKFIKSEIMRDL